MPNGKKCVIKYLHLISLELLTKLFKLLTQAYKQNAISVKQSQINVSFYFYNFSEKKINKLD